MAGIVDFLNSDEAALGLGLLAASGPTTDPNQTGLGRVLAAGSQFANATRRANAELALRESEARRKAMIENLGIQLLTGGSSVPAGASEAGGASTPGVGSTGGGALIGPGAGPALGGVNPQAAGADLLFNSGKGIGGMIAERTTPKWTNVGGNLVNTNAPGFAGGIQRQIVTGRDGQVYEVAEMPDGRVVTRVDPSSIAAFRQFQDISNTSRARTTPGRETILPGGRMGGQSQAQEIGLDQPPAVTSAPLIGPGAGPTNAAERGMAAAVAEPNPNPVQAAMRERAALVRELPNASDPQSQAAMRYQIGELDKVIASGGAGIQTATPAALIGPGAGVPAAPLPVQTTIAGGGTQFSPTEQAQFATQQKAAESAAGQTGTMLAEGKQQANNAVQAIGTVQRINRALDTSNAFTGKAANARIGAAQWAEALGLGGKSNDEKLANTRVLLQELAKLTMQGRRQMSGQGAITESESQLAVDANSGRIDFTPAEMRVLANAAERSARFQYGLHEQQLRAAANNPAIAGQLGMFQPAPLPEAPAPAQAPGLPAGWSGGKK